MIKKLLISVCLIAVTVTAEEDRRRLMVVSNVAAASTTVTNIETLTWQSNIVASGSTVATNTLLAAQNFVRSAMSNSFWSKLTVVCPVAGNDIVAARHYLKPAGTITNATQLGTAMTYNETGASGGVVGDGSTKYWNTQYNPSGDSTSSFSLWAWCHTASAGGTSTTILGNGGSSATAMLGWFNSGTQETGVLAGTPGSQYATGTNSGSTGFLGLNVSGSRSLQWYDDAAPVGSPTTQTGTFQSSEIYFNALNDSGALNKGTRRTSFWVIATGLSGADITNLYSAVLQFQTELTRN